MKISAWLEEIAYDGNYDSAELKADFETRTEHTPPEWPEETLAAGLERDTTIRALERTPADLRHWQPIPATVPRDTIVAYGIEIAQTIEDTFIPGRRPEADHYSGRGRNYRAILEHLRAAGL